MSADQNSGPNDDRIEEAFLIYCESSLDGTPPDPDEFLKSYPEIEGELRARINEFLFVSNGLKRHSARSDSTMQEAQGQTDVQGKTLGDFSIIREIGRGGMGVVYEARQISLGRIVAVKVLPAHLTLREESVKRFKREASTTARLSHPGIVEIYAVGEEDGAHFFVMEFIEGTPLDKVIESIRFEGIQPVSGARIRSAVASGMHRRGENPFLQAELKESDEEEGKADSAFWNRTYIETVCRIVAKMADALDYAHKAGVIHRDVKPSNILVRHDGTCVLTDFGLAREEGFPSITITGEFAGTPHYVSPEQAMHRRGKVDHRADIYSLGVTLFELLTLNRPFDGKTSHEVLGKIIAKEPPLLRTLNNLIPRDLETICLAAMEKDPAHRYQTAMEFRQDIDRFLAFKPVRACPVGVARRTMRWIQRNTAYSAVIILIFLVVVVGPLIFGFQQKYANIQIRREARTVQHIFDFIINLFKVVEPSETLGKKITAFEVLQKGVELVDRELGDQPEIQAELKQTLGMIHISLGLYQDAEPLLESAFHALKDLSGNRDPATLKAQHCLANLYRLEGKYDKALPLYQQGLADLRRTLGDEAPETLALMNDMGDLYRLTNRNHKAEAVYLQTLEAQHRLLGDDDPETLKTMNNLAFLYMQIGWFDKAEPLYEKSYEGRKKVLGKDHPDTITSVNNLAVLYAKQKRFDEAAPLYQASLEDRCRILGEKHPETITSLFKLAIFFLMQERFDEAEPLFLRALDDRRQVLGNDHPKTLIVNTYLANLRAGQGRFDEALPLYEDTLQLMMSIIGLEHRFTIFTMHHFAEFYHGRGLYHEAEVLAREVLLHTEPNHPDYRLRKDLMEDILRKTNRTGF